MGGDGHQHRCSGRFRCWHRQFDSASRLEQGGPERGRRQPPQQVQPEPRAGAASPGARTTDLCVDAGRPWRTGKPGAAPPSRQRRCSSVHWARVWHFLRPPSSCAAGQTRPVAAHSESSTFATHAAVPPFDFGDRIAPRPVAFGCTNPLFRGVREVLLIATLLKTLRQKNLWASFGSGSLPST